MWEGMTARRRFPEPGMCVRPDAYAIFRRASQVFAWYLGAMQNTFEIFAAMFILGLITAVWEAWLVIRPAKGSDTDKPGP